MGLETGTSGNFEGRPKELPLKAKITKRAVCLSLEALSERAEQGDPRAQELLIESVIHLENFLRAG